MVSLLNIHFILQTLPADETGWQSDSERILVKSSDCAKKPNLEAVCSREDSAVSI
jgi:hypothetical protein